MIPKLLCGSLWRLSLPFVIFTLAVSAENIKNECNPAAQGGCTVCSSCCHATDPPHGHTCDTCAKHFCSRSLRGTPRLSASYSAPAHVISTPSEFQDSLLAVIKGNSCSTDYK